MERHLANAIDALVAKVQDLDMDEQCRKTDQAGNG